MLGYKPPFVQSLPLDRQRALIVAQPVPAGPGPSIFAHQNADALNRSSFARTFIGGSGMRGIGTQPNPFERRPVSVGPGAFQSSLQTPQHTARPLYAQPPPPGSALPGRRPVSSMAVSPASWPAHAINAAAPAAYGSRPSFAEVFTSQQSGSAGDAGVRAATPSGQGVVRATPVMPVTASKPADADGGAQPLIPRFDAGASTVMGTYPGKAANQDRSVMSQGACSVFGVFDGHGPEGHHVAEFVSNKLPISLTAIGALDDGRAPSTVAAVEASHLATTRAIQSSSSMDATASGCTSCVIFMPNARQLVTCNLGDSRAVIGRSDPSVRRLIASDLSTDHKPDSPSERYRIESAGGIVCPSRAINGVPIGPARVWDASGRFGLATSRAFGDLRYNMSGGGGVISEPEISFHDITASDRLLVLGSDGVWDRVSSQEAVDIAAGCAARGAKCAAEQIVKTAQARWLRDSPMQDDITAVVVLLQPTTS